MLRKLEPARRVWELRYDQAVKPGLTERIRQKNVSNTGNIKVSNTGN